MNRERRYVLISPCRNEAELHAPHARQRGRADACPPRSGSSWTTDRATRRPTSCRSTRALPWLSVVRRRRPRAAERGPGRDRGLLRRAARPWTSTRSTTSASSTSTSSCPPRYFELLIARMEADPRLGHDVRASRTSSGRGDGALVPEADRRRDVGGRRRSSTGRRCFREIGGFVREVMWDGIDCHRCRMLGWTAESVDDRGPALRAPAADGLEPEGHLDGPRAHGFRAVLHGHRARFLLASAAFRLFKHPVLYGSVAMLWGYFGSAARGRPRYDDAGFRRFLRRYQRRVPAPRQARGDAAAGGGASARLGAAHDRTRAGAIPWNAARPELLGCPFDRVTCAPRSRSASTGAGARAPPTPWSPPTRRILCMMRRDPELRAGLPARATWCWPTACRWCGRRAWPASRSPSA